jgi:hypothetical protein
MIVAKVIRWSVLMALVVLGGVARADDDGKLTPGEPLGINGTLEGKSYGDWASAWWVWAYALPYSKSFANFDATVSAGADCSLYQDPGSKVWFLAGTSSEAA